MPEGGGKDGELRHGAILKQTRGELDPVLRLETRDLIEVLEVVGDEDQPESQRMGRDESDIRTNRRSLPRQISGEAAETICGKLIERGNGDVSNKGADQGMELPRLSEVGAVAQLRQRDRADAHFGGPVLAQLQSNVPLTPEREAHGVNLRGKRTTLRLKVTFRSL